MSRALLAFVLSLTFYTGALLVAEPSPNGDEPHYALLALSIARDGDLDLTNDYGDPARTRAVFGNPDLGLQAYHYPGTTGLHSIHNVGLSVLLAPAALVSDPLLWMRLTMVLIAAIAAVLLMRLLERVRFGTPATRWAAWAAVVFSAPMVVYAGSLFTEMPAVLLVLAAAVLLTRPRVEPAALAGAASAAAALPWLNVRFLIITLALALILVWRAWSCTRRGLAIAAVAVPLAVSGAAMMVAFSAWYGSPWPNAPYAFTEGTRTLSGAYRYGIGGFFSADFGWLPFAPVHLLGIAALGLVVGALGRSAWIGIAATVLYVLVLAVSGVGFPGTGFPGRMQLVLVPFAAVGLLVLLVRRPGWRWAVAALAVLSLVLTLRAVTDPIATVAPAPGTVAHAYADVWPDYHAVPAQVTWADTESTTGSRGVLLRTTTTALPKDEYTLAVALRADRATPQTVARIRAVDAGGRAVWDYPVTGALAAADQRIHVIALPFRVTDPGPLAVRVDATGGARVRVARVDVASRPGSSQARVNAYPDWLKTLAWIAALVLAGVLMARQGRKVRHHSSTDSSDQISRRRFSRPARWSSIRTRTASRSR